MKDKKENAVLAFQSIGIKKKEDRNRCRQKQKWKLQLIEKENVRDKEMKRESKKVLLQSYKREKNGLS